MKPYFQISFLGLCLLAIASSSFAQSAPAPTGREAVNTLLDQKEQFLKEHLELDDIEHELFVPMYVKYMEEILLIDDSRTQYQNSLVRAADYVSEQELSILSDGMLETERQRVDQKQKFYDQLVVQFGVKKATLWLRAEIEFQKRLRELYAQSRSQR